MDYDPVELLKELYPNWASFKDHLVRVFEEDLMFAGSILEMSDDLQNCYEDIMSSKCVGAREIDVALNTKGVDYAEMERQFSTHINNKVVFDKVFLKLIKFPTSDTYHIAPSVAQSVVNRLKMDHDATIQKIWRREVSIKSKNIIQIQQDLLISLAKSHLTVFVDGPLTVFRSSRYLHTALKAKIKVICCIKTKIRPILEEYMRVKA